MLSGRFAQAMEFAGIACLLGGVIALCQPFSMWVYTQGFKPLLLGWVLLTIFSHRKPIQQAEAQPSPDSAGGGANRAH